MVLNKVGNSMNKRWLFAAASAIVLAGCDGGSDQDDVSLPDGRSLTLRCDTISGGSAQTTSSVDPLCVGCAVTDADAVADDDPRSFASMDATDSPPQQSVRIRSTAQPGIVFPAGSRVGAFVTRPPASGIDAQSVVTINTYAGGVLQESGTRGASTCIADCGSLNDVTFNAGDDLPKTFLWFETDEPFDAVEIGFSAPGIHMQRPVVLKVYGLCSDGELRGVP